MSITATDAIDRALHYADMTSTTAVALAEDCTVAEIAERISARADLAVDPADVRRWLADRGVPLCTSETGAGMCEEPGREVRRGVVRCRGCEAQ